MNIVSRNFFNMGDEVESNLPQSYNNEPSEHSRGSSIQKDNGEVLLTTTDLQQTIIDVPLEEFGTHHVEVEEEKFEDVSNDEFEIDYEDESQDEHEDEFKDKFKDDAP